MNNKKQQDLLLLFFENIIYKLIVYIYFIHKHIGLTLSKWLTRKEQSDILVLPINRKGFRCSKRHPCLPPSAPGATRSSRSASGNSWPRTISGMATSSPRSGLWRNPLAFPETASVRPFMP